MHISRIELENFKTIKSFAADFTGGVYLVTGENEIGKSTLLGAIGTLLTGQRTDNLLRKGEEKGFAKMTVGEGEDSYTVELRVTEKNPRGVITVEKKDTGLKSNNITALQGLFKYQDFDAHEFVKWSETAEGRRRQVEVVMSLLPAEVQTRLNAIETEVKQLKENRTPVNAEIKAYLNLLDKAGVTPDDLKKYAKTKDLQKLINQKAEAEAAATQAASVKERLAEREAELENLPAQQAALKTQFEKSNEDISDEFLQLKKQYEAARAKLTKRTEEIEARFLERQQEINAGAAPVKEKIKAAKAWLKEQEKNPVDIEKLQEEINTVEQHNKKAQQVAQYGDNKKLFKAASAAKETIEGNILKLLNERQELVDKSEIPVPGLDFGEEGLTLQGIPFKTGEVSTSQEMEVAAKLIIAKNPTVKVFRIAQGESLGKERLAAIVDFATANGYQGFIEEVHRGQEELIIEKYQQK